MKNEVAYCGLYCPKCYKNSVSGAAEELKRALLQTKNICGKAALISQEMDKELDSLIGLRCVNFCRAGGTARRSLFCELIPGANFKQ